MDNDEDLVRAMIRSYRFDALDVRIQPESFAWYAVSKWIMGQQHFSKACLDQADLIALFT